MIGSARADGKAEGHRLQGPRLIAGNFEAFDLWREVDCVVSDTLCQAAAAFGQCVAESFTPADQSDGA